MQQDKIYKILIKSNFNLITYVKNLYYNSINQTWWKRQLRSSCPYLLFKPIQDGSSRGFSRMWGEKTPLPP